MIYRTDVINDQVITTRSTPACGAFRYSPIADPETAFGAMRYRKPLALMLLFWDVCFAGGDDGLLQHLEHGSGVLIAEPHCHRFGVDGLRQRKQRGLAADIVGE